MLDRDDEATMFFIIKTEETIFGFLQNLVSITQNGDSKNHKFII